MNNACLLSFAVYRYLHDGPGSPFQVRNRRQLCLDALMGAREVYFATLATLSTLPMVKTRLMVSALNGQTQAGRVVAPPEV